MLRKLGRGATALLGVVLALGVGGCVQWGWKTPRDFFAVYQLPDPGEREAVLCHAYSCQARTSVQFSPAEWKEIEGLFVAVSTPAEERQAIGLAVASFERMSGERMGTSNDPGGVINMNFSGNPDHLDCVDEAANTTTYLIMLEQAHLMTRHQVEPPDIRGLLIDGRWPHYTAVLLETGSSQKWAVDSWVHDNGEPPVIQTLSEWRRG